MMARRKKNMLNTPAGETVRAFADAAVAVAKLRNDIPDRELVDCVAKDGSTRGDGLVALSKVRDILAESGRVYAHQDDILLTDARNTSFKVLAMDGRAEPKAGSKLANLVAAVQYFPNQSTGEIEQWEFRLPDAFCDQLFAMDRCSEKLPVVDVYATHSVFDDTFKLSGPGYHADSRILVQGPNLCPDVSVLPAVPSNGPRTVAESINQLPHHLRLMLKDFDWASVVDLINAIGTLLMGLLMNHFIEDGHPAVFVRGNQPAIGKSLLAKVIGMVFDGRRVAAIKKSGDEEFDKLLCAMLKKRRRMVFLDNLRNKLDSERIEQVITSPKLMIRMLGTNEFGEWDNDVLFVLTSNNFVVGKDLVSRNLVIDLYTEGDPRKRQAERKASNPLRFAEVHRTEILSELAAMVLRWLDAGQPHGELNSRFERVTEIVGGILTANGFPGFASNAEAAADEMDEDQQRMLELAQEIIAGTHGPESVVRVGEDASRAGRLAGAWVQAFERLNLIDTKQKPEATLRSKGSTVGKIFSSFIGRPLRVEHDHCPYVVTIQKRDASGNRSFWYANVDAVDTGMGGIAEEPNACTAAPATEGPEGPVVAPTPPAPQAASEARAGGWMTAAASIPGPLEPPR
jgi:hypothetical protein